MPEHNTRRQYPTAPESVAQARTQVREFLRRWDITEDGNEDAENVILVVSELVTNAVRHSRGLFTLSVDLYGDVCHVAVKDSAEHSPAKTIASASAETGRGVFLVDALASDWGWRAEPVGKTTWAEIRIKVPSCTE